jgi:hypothetical protein
MWWDYDKAVKEHMEYEKTATGGWRATFEGAFTSSAEAESPEDAARKVMNQLDRLVAAWIVRVPEKRAAKPRTKAIQRRQPH